MDGAKACTSRAVDHVICSMLYIHLDRLLIRVRGKDRYATYQLLLHEHKIALQPCLQVFEQLPDIIKALALSCAASFSSLGV